MPEAAAKTDSARPLPLLAKGEAEPPESETWIRRLRWAALAVFAAVPFLGLLAQAYAGRIVWTIVIAALPLFIVLVGYHRWRRICPLAFVNQIPVMLRRPGARRASAWLEANYAYVSFAVFFVSLWTRLIATNGSGAAIALFFVLISLAALAFGAQYTGKTWCNFVCPLSFIEKIYTEPHGLRETANSQCPKCTACKSSCPDINEENGYWKEIDSRSKRFAYYAFPGIVFAFYFYYYLQSGTWDYYFSGRWTDEPGVILTAFFPGSEGHAAGFFFLPAVPRAAAAALTLATLSLSSFLFFSWLEGRVGRYLRDRQPEVSEARVRSATFGMAAFTAFVTFYTFAGQPTLRKIPWAPQIAGVLVVAAATLFLSRRLRRTQQEFMEETVARGILKRWEWSAAQPRDAQEAYLIHNLLTRARKESYAKLLAVYRETVREAVADRLLAREDLGRLESLRNRLGIKNFDHQRIMAELAEEERAMLMDPAGRPTAEKRLQIETYERVLARHLRSSLSGADTRASTFVRQLRLEYGVTKAEHAAVFEHLIGGEHEAAERLTEGLVRLERDAQTCRLLEAEPWPAQAFLAELLRRGQRRAVRRLLLGLYDTLDEEAIQVVTDCLCSPAEDLKEVAVASLRAHVSPRLADLIMEARRQAAAGSAPGGDATQAIGRSTLEDRLIGLTESWDPYVCAAALHLLAGTGEAGGTIARRLESDESEIVRETAASVNAAAEARKGDRGAPIALSRIEKMIALRRIAIFATLAPENLSDLAMESHEAAFAPDAALCQEGEPSQDVFILLEGEVTVLHLGGAREIILATAAAGSVLGEMAVLNRAPRSATVRAGANGARALVLDGDSFRRSLYDDPRIADAVIHTLAQRLGGADNVIESLAAEREKRATSERSVISPTERPSR